MCLVTCWNRLQTASGEQIAGVFWPDISAVFDDGLITSLALGMSFFHQLCAEAIKFILLIQGSEIMMFLLCFPLKT